MSSDEAQKPAPVAILTKDYSHRPTTGPVCGTALHDLHTHAHEEHAEVGHESLAERV